MKPFDEHEDYSLNMLSDWVKESLESPHTPQQVYETIVRTVREKRDYHETCYNHSKKLLELLKGESTPTLKQETITFSGKNGSPESVSNSSLEREVDKISEEGGYEWTPGT